MASPRRRLEHLIASEASAALAKLQGAPFYYNYYHYGLTVEESEATAAHAGGEGGGEGG
eukprot:CAMPEP_0119377516 /NCGR_PEP_ID=MMETSP1334-20130426/45299_1 /TAXON_ID=127549 /ORGANISM="Calcidiscus leptoporus, Strain RCC1130" /LENGTH=58 /DNA_ID=CAMNT_0007396465 /DNA_START=86 /DNA_END=259 /DNA_ORIENTATION=-